ADTPALTLATTTSTQDSGLLAVLLPPFEKQCAVKTKVLAVGTGQALELGRRGDVDVLMVHAPEKEAAFVKAGHGLPRRPFMYNDFIIIGPKEDSAGIRGMSSAAETFRKIAEKKSFFASRGDESGTHTKERAIWRKAEIEPQGDWYLEAGTGMAGTLRLANEKQAYTLSDRSTFLAWKDKLDLEILVERDEIFKNVYSVIIVSPARHPNVSYETASRFADYLFSTEAKKIISHFGEKKFGQPLFHIITEKSPPADKR
ncbi:MAG: solute-binding protein, partial [Armatimonadetes bacterium]|nr:solute-binding protein [Armatimonadota bacterium]NIO98216.1 solute-binding protein [Armatimonadota bacterium]